METDWITEIFEEFHPVDMKAVQILGEGEYSELLSTAPARAAGANPRPTEEDKKDRPGNRSVFFVSNSSAQFAEH